VWCRLRAAAMTHYGYPPGASEYRGDGDVASGFERDVYSAGGQRRSPRDSRAGAFELNSKSLDHERLILGVHGLPSPDGMRWLL